MSELSISEPVTNDTLVGQIADEFLERVERGEEPRVEEYTQKHPEIAPVLRQVLPALRIMRSPAMETLPTEMEPTLSQLGDYRIVREVGRGGMGIVYEAEQVSLGRRVALKVLPFAAAVEPRQLQRFKQEAQAAAHLLHQNIVAVYAVGCERGVHYYAMQFVDGQSLAAVIAEMRQQSGSTPTRTPRAGALDQGAETESMPRCRLSTERSAPGSDFFRSVARLGIQAAEALEHAHQQGILHRDVKPANLMVDAAGHLWITDFGLARFHREAGLTQTGDVVGTLRYISPEQALGPNALVDQRTDVYGLGATLYELLTLRPIHDGQNRNELMRQIERTEPLALHRLTSNVPAELETIIHKAIAHHSADRYATAQDFADDLRRFLEDKPIQARRPTFAQRLRKWRRRHPGIVRATTIVFLVGVALLSAGSVVIWHEKEQATQAQAQAEMERRRAEVRYRLARIAPDDVYTDVIQNWLAETEVMRKWLTTEAQHQVENELLRKALAYYEEQVATAARDPEMRLESAIAHRRMGEVLQKLERPGDAESAYREAVALFEELHSAFPEVPDYGLNLIVNSCLLARLLAEDPKRVADAERTYQQGLVLGCEMARRFADIPDVLLAKASVATGLGELYRRGRRFADAEKHHGQALDVLRRLASTSTGKPEHHSRLGRALHALARVRIDQDELGAAAPLLREAVRQQQAALTSHSNYPDYRQALTEHFQELFPVLFRLGSHREAAEDAELFASLLPERGCDVSAAVQVLNVCVELVARETDRPEADRTAIRRRYIERARELHQEAVRRSDGDPDLQNLLAWQLATLPQEWIHNPARGVELAQEATRKKPMEPSFWTTLGLARYRAGDSSGAIEALNEAVRLGNGGTARDWLYMALAHRQLDRGEEARKWYERAVADQGSDASNDWELKSLRAEVTAAFTKPAESH